MKTLIAAFTALAACWCNLSAAETPPAGNAPHDAPPPNIGLLGDSAGAGGPVLEDAPVPDRREKRLRRFEIVFFTSLPASVLLSLLGIVAYRSAAGRSGDFSAAEYRTLALSAVGISLGIAVSDSLKAGSGRPRERGRR